jgi:hypothetical protein
MVMAFPLGVLASHQFGDVPNSNIFHGDIDALVDAGVTAGCGGGNYCPNQAVTRGQMAAFMNRLGALAPGKVPVVNADRLDGYHANQLSRVAIASSNGVQALPAVGALGTLLSVSITTPGPGFVHVTATTTAFTSDAGCVCELLTFLNDGGTNVGRNGATVQAGGAHVASIGNQWVFTVAAAGEHTFNLVGGNFEAPTELASVQFRQMVAVYTPFGSEGGSTLGAMDTPTEITAPAGE